MRLGAFNMRRHSARSASAGRDGVDRISLSKWQRSDTAGVPALFASQALSGQESKASDEEKTAERRGTPHGEGSGHQQ